jgi:hypothetical protein
MPPIAAGFVFSSHDRRRLKAAMRRVRDARHCRRLEAVWLVAKGHSVGATANLRERQPALSSPRRWPATERVAARRIWPKANARVDHPWRPGLPANA